MISRAVKNGASLERIAAALNISTQGVKASLNLLIGISHEAVELLKDKPIPPKSLRLLKKVTDERQVEIARLTDGIADLPLPQEDISQIVVRLGVIGLDPQGLLEVGDGFLDLACLRQSDPQIGVRFGVIGLAPQRLFIMPDGIADLTLPHEDSSQIVVCLGVIRLDP